jgi:hypothetical protein
MISVTTSGSAVFEAAFWRSAVNTRGTSERSAKVAPVCQGRLYRKTWTGTTAFAVADDRFVDTGVGVPTAVPARGGTSRRLDATGERV